MSEVPEPVVRLARPSDLRRIAAIENSGVAAFREHFGEAMVPALAAPAPSGSERDGHGFLLVASVGRALVGFAHVVDHEGEGRIAHLEQVSVLPEHGRRGIGRRLVVSAMEEARWAGFDRLSLTTYRDVPWNGPFYAALGFAEVERPERFQSELRRREHELGLDGPGPRIVMDVALVRPLNTGY